MFAVQCLRKSPLVANQLVNQTSRAVHHGMLAGKPRVRGSVAEKITLSFLFCAGVMAYPMYIMSQMPSYRRSS